MPVRKFSIPSCPADHDVPQLPVVDASFSKYADALRRISLAIHEYKELSFQEHRSSALLADFAGAEGFVVERGIAGDATAFLATYRQGDGPVVSFNAVIMRDLLIAEPRNTMHSLKLAMGADIILSPYPH